jgi:hypothetical protein
MSPVTHLLSGWLLSNAVKLNRRDRLLTTAAAIIPDIDGIGIVADHALRRRFGDPSGA